MSERPILVTGCPRSGTTWVGDVLSTGTGVFHIYEPFNRWAPRPVSPTEWPAAERVVHMAGAPDAYRKGTREILQRRFPTTYWAQLPAALATRRLERWASPLRDYLLARALRRRRVLLKDPRALLSADWLYDNFDFQVLCLVRHPAGVVAGFKRMKWKLHAEWYLEKPALMHDLLAPVRPAIEAHVGHEGDSVGAGIVSWLLHATAILRWLEAYPQWSFVPYEQVAAEPLATFEQLFGALGLPFGPQARARIERTSGGQAGASLGTAQHVLVRDSRAAAASWKKRLDDEELRRIADATEGVRQRLADHGFVYEF